MDKYKPAKFSMKKIAKFSLSLKDEAYAYYEEELKDPRNLVTIEQSHGNYVVITKYSIKYNPKPDIFYIDKKGNNRYG